MNLLNIRNFQEILIKWNGVSIWGPILCKIGPLLIGEILLLKHFRGSNDNKPSTEEKGVGTLIWEPQEKIQSC